MSSLNRDLPLQTRSRRGTQFQTALDKLEASFSDDDKQRFQKLKTNPHAHVFGLESLSKHDAGIVGSRGSSPSPSTVADRDALQPVAGAVARLFTITRELGVLQTPGIEEEKLYTAIKGLQMKAQSPLRANKRAPEILQDALDRVTETLQTFESELGPTYAVMHDARYHAASTSLRDETFDFFRQAMLLFADNPVQYDVLESITQFSVSTALMLELRDEEESFETVESDYEYTIRSRESSIVSPGPTQSSYQGTFASRYASPWSQRFESPDPEQIVVFGKAQSDYIRQALGVLPEDDDEDAAEDEYNKQNAVAATLEQRETSQR